MCSPGPDPLHMLSQLSLLLPVLSAAGKNTGGKKKIYFFIQVRNNPHKAWRQQVLKKMSQGSASARQENHSVRGTNARVSGLHSSQGSRLHRGSFRSARPPRCFSSRGINPESRQGAASEERTGDCRSSRCGQGLNPAPFVRAEGSEPLRVRRLSREHGRARTMATETHRRAPSRAGARATPLLSQPRGPRTPRSPARLAVPARVPRNLLDQWPPPAVNGGKVPGVSASRARETTRGAGRRRGLLVGRGHTGHRKR